MSKDKFMENIEIKQSIQALQNQIDILNTQITELESLKYKIINLEKMDIVTAEHISNVLANANNTVNTNIGFMTGIMGVITIVIATTAFFGYQYFRRVIKDTIKEDDLFKTALADYCDSPKFKQAINDQIAVINGYDPETGNYHIDLNTYDPKNAPTD